MKVLNVLLLVLFASLVSAQGGSIKRVLEPVGDAVPGQYVVVLDEGVEPHGLVNGLKKSGQAEILHEYKIINGFAVRMNINALENAVKHIKGVTIYDDPIVTAITLQNPAGSWGLDRVDQTIGGDGVYTHLRDGTDVDVYIVDTGIQIEHDDFDGPWRDNRATYGENFITGEGPGDGNGHGTHVAGTSY
jgi:subtilisin family serine protease